MADNLQLSARVGDGGTVATDEIAGGITGGTAHWPLGKMAYGGLGTAILASDDNPYPVRGTVSVSNAVSITGNIGGTVAISGTPPVSVVGTVPVHLSNLGTVLVSGNVEVVNDVGNPLPVSGTVTVNPISGTVAVSGAVDTELTTADLDTGAGSDTRAVVGLVYGASGGAGTVTSANGLPVSHIGGISGTVAITGNVNTVENSGTLAAITGTVPVRTTNNGTVSVSGVVDARENSGTLAAITGTVPVRTTNDGTVSVSGAVTLAASGTVVGPAAHDAAISGAPVRTGGRAGTANVGTVSHDDVVDFVADKVGRQVVAPHTRPEDIIQGTVILTNTTAGTVIGPQGPTLRQYITTVWIANSGTIDTIVQISDGGTASVKAWLPAAKNAGGAAPSLPVPLTGFSLNGTVMANCIIAPAGGSVYITMIGYRAP